MRFTHLTKKSAPPRAVLGWSANRPRRSPSPKGKGAFLVACLFPEGGRRVFCYFLFRQAYANRPTNPAAANNRVNGSGTGARTNPSVAPPASVPYPQIHPALLMPVASVRVQPVGIMPAYNAFKSCSPFTLSQIKA